MNINLSHNFSVCNISTVDLNNRQRWWIKQPLAASEQGKSNSLNSIPTSPPLVVCNVFGGMDREPKKKPPLRLPLFGAVLRLPYPPCFLNGTRKYTHMIYSFLVAPKHLTLSSLARTEIVRIHSKSIESAKASLKGKTFALISRLPVGGAI